jgi:hypothetical protein
MAPPVATAPTWPGMAPVFPQAPSAVPGWPPYTGRPMSGGVLAALIAGTALAAILVVGILAAVAIPTFLQQRAKAEAANTTVVMPEQVVGLTRLHDARSLQLEQQLRAQTGLASVAVYGESGEISVAVAVDKHLMSDGDLRNFLAGVDQGSQGRVVHVTDVSPGRLGGVMRCATSTTSQFSICMFADHGAYGSIVLSGKLIGRTDTAVAIREAVEHRR